jgi:Ca-activated chloride channel family protein
MILDAPWVTSAKRAAAEQLGAWLEGRLTPRFLARFHYRPGEPGIAPQQPISRVNGALPDHPKRLLSLPTPRVLAEIKKAWHEDRKPANVLLVVDVSGSMNDEDRIGQARRGLLTFLGQLSPQDRVGLMTFSSEPRLIDPVRLVRDSRATVRQHVTELVADGDTALYRAATLGWRNVDALADDTRINAVVVLSDGADTVGFDGELRALTTQLRQRAQGEGRQIRMFTIAYGSDANTDVLGRIAAASGAESYSGDPDDIAAVYLQISSYF